MLRIVIYLLLFQSFNVLGQDLDCYDGRYQSEVFPESEIAILNEVKFATVVESNGNLLDLTYDVYYSKSDSITDRPVIVLAHGGAFLKLTNQKSPDIVHISKRMAQRGYAVVTITYRQESDIFSLLSEERMIKAVGRALADIRNVTCHLMDTTLLHNNPYNVDPSKVIIGGVSAGSIAFLQAVFLENVDQLPEQYKDWILEVVPNANELLANKYCGANILGLINISGALLDTAWIDNTKINEYPAMYHLHGTEDLIVPYDYDYPLGLNNLPKLMGSKLIHEHALRLGIPSQIDVYRGQGHAPILGVNWENLLSGQLEDFLIHPIIMPTTIDRITDFAYNLIDCNELQSEIVSGINDDQKRNVKIYPNPSRGEFNIELPGTSSQNLILSIVDIKGEIVEQSAIDYGSLFYSLKKELTKGIYQIILKSKEDIYSARLIVQ